MRFWREHSSEGERNKSIVISDESAALDREQNAGLSERDPEARSVLDGRLQ